MKALPCQTPDCTGAPKSRGTIMLPDGKPYLIGRSTSFPLIAKCARCKRPSSFSAQAFGILAHLTVAQLAKIGELETLAKDWTGAGLQREHAHDLISAGLMGPGAVEHRKVEPMPPEKIYSTGMECPTSGVWRAKGTKRTIPLTKGEKFPPNRKKGAVWVLERTA